MSLHAAPVFGAPGLRVTAIEQRTVRLERQAPALLAFARSEPIALVVIRDGHRQVLKLDGSEADLGEMRREHADLDDLLQQITGSQVDHSV